MSPRRSKTFLRIQYTCNVYLLYTSILLIYKIKLLLISYLTTAINSKVKSRLNTEIWVLAVPKKLLLYHDFDCSTWPILLNISKNILSEKRVSIIIDIITWISRFFPQDFDVIFQIQSFDIIAHNMSNTRCELITRDSARNFSPS